VYNLQERLGEIGIINLGHRLQKREKYIVGEGSDLLDIGFFKENRIV